MKEIDQAAEKKKRKMERLLIGLTVATILILTVLEANIASSITNIPFFGNVLIFIVINLNVLLIVFLLFLVSRNFFKLFLERKRNVLGSKIRYRLVITFLVFSLIPMVLFFFISYKLTTASIKTFIGGQVGEGLHSSIMIAREYISGEEKKLEDFLKSGSARAERVEDLEWAPETVAEITGDGVIFRVGDKGDLNLEDFLKYREERGEEGLVIHTEGQYIFGSISAPGEKNIVAVKRIPDGIYKDVAKVSAAYSKYRQFRILNDPIKATNLGILIMVTLLIIFTNTWIGFYLARDFSIPLKKLAEGTEKLSKGEELVTIEHDSDDEFGLLVDSFNRMAKEMVQSRHELEKLNRELEGSYYELSMKADLIGAIITSISTGVINIDKRGKVNMINQVAREMLEIEGDVEGMSYRECFAKSVYEDIRREIGALRPGFKETAEKNVRFTSEGVEKDLIVRTTILKKGGDQYQGVVVTIDDISDIKRIQEIAAWGEVARKVAHEIKNPLTPIKLSAQRLMKRYGEEDISDDQLFNECIDTIISEVDLIGKLVDEFYRFARMPETRKDRGDLKALASQIVNNYVELYPGMEFKLDVKGDIPRLEFDPANMKRVFVNLLENSLWAVRERGADDGRVSVTLESEASGNTVKISVEDNGIGVPAESHDNIFKLHFSMKEGGKGLGLSIVKSIIEAHEGKVYSEKTDGAGARLIVELPVTKELS